MTSFEWWGVFYRDKLDEGQDGGSDESENKDELKEEMRTEEEAPPMQEYEPNEKSPLTDETKVQGHNIYHDGKG